jgi:hypothetical protein
VPHSSNFKGLRLQTALWVPSEPKRLFGRVTNASAAIPYSRDCAGPRFPVSDSDTTRGVTTPAETHVFIEIAGERWQPLRPRKPSSKNAEPHPRAWIRRRPPLEHLAMLSSARGSPDFASVDGLLRKVRALDECPNVLGHLRVFFQHHPVVIVGIQPDAL